MARQDNQGFSTVKTEGLLLPPELIARVADLGAKLPAIRPEDYHLAKGERINEATNRAWNRLTTLWARFRKELEALPQGEAATGPTRERWLLPLFQELGYGRLQRHAAFEIEGKSYAISHLWSHAPIHLVGAGLDLDKRAPGKAGAAQASPHGLVQQFLNRTDDHLWAFLSNGLKLRILRDNLSLTRQAYVEFDLAAMMDGELYSDFRLLWLLCHQSRVESERPEQCWLEKWAQEARAQGARALDHLREGVETAISALGSGFLAHPSNTALQARLASGELESQDYYRQLLRFVYRLIFLFVAEDRDLLLTGDDEAAKHRYGDYYSTARLRRIAHRLKGGRHEDLYEGLKVVMVKLHEEGCPELALPALGSFLWDPDKLPDLSAAHIRNRDFLEAIRALSFVQQERTLRPIDYRNLGPEELGSVYESLLELHPELHREAATFELKTAAGSERKTTGSYYTPESLIQELLNSALDPVLDRAASQPEPEQAILNLKVCDPAAGSGHFLVAAAHRIARQLAAARSGDEEPAPGEVTLALRDVVSHCLYGVDINEMAVELCKVSLWMTAMAPGRPLSFLDHRIRCGNSLLGTTPALMAKGVPDDAFKPLTGDKKELCSAYKAQNKKERKSRMDDLFRQGESAWSRLCKLSYAVTRMAGIADDDINAVREQAAVYASVAGSEECRHSHLVANAWCAAFVWVKQEDPKLPYPITQAAFRRLEESPDKCPDWMHKEIQRLTSNYQFFHWHLEFPDVLRAPGQDTRPENDAAEWEGGFDVLFGNPPWDQIQFDARDYFSRSRGDIAEAPHMAARNRKIKQLESDDPDVYHDYLKAMRRVDGMKHFLHASSVYPLTSRGRLNLAPLFAELAEHLLGDTGRSGQVLPSGIATDSFTQHFFDHIINAETLVSLYDFENRNALFPGVHRAYKFSLVTLRLRIPAQPSFPPVFVFFAHEVSDLTDANRRFELSREEIALLNPNTNTCPIFRSNKDKEITFSIYLRFAILDSDVAPSSGAGWGYKPRLMFMTNTDSKDFFVSEELEEGGFVLSGNVFSKDGHRFLPLYEAKMYQLFDHRASDIVISKKAAKRQGQTAQLTMANHADPNRSALPRYWIAEELIVKAVGSKERTSTIAVSKVTSPTNARTFVASLLPPSGIADSSFYISLENTEITPKNKAALLANISCFCFDYVARQKLGGVNMLSFVQRQLPVIDRKSFEQACSWEINSALEKWILCRVMELVYTSFDMRSFAQEVGANHGPYRWDENRRSLIRCELDAAFFHLYLPADEHGDWRPARRADGCPHDETPEQLAELKRHFPTPRDAVSYIMETFPIVKRKDIQKYGDYRTKLFILDIYDKMQTAMETGEPYQTLLDPPPGDPRCCHPPREMAQAET